MAITARTDAQFVFTEGAGGAWGHSVVSRVGYGVRLCAHWLDVLPSASSAGGAALSFTIS